jgi:hypothetical protein
MRGFSLYTSPQNTVLPRGHQILTQFKEIIAFFRDYAKHINTNFGQNTEIQNIKQVVYMCFNIDLSNLKRPHPLWVTTSFPLSEYRET